MLNKFKVVKPIYVYDQMESQVFPFAYNQVLLSITEELSHKYTQKQRYTHNKTFLLSLYTMCVCMSLFTLL